MSSKPNDPHGWVLWLNEHLLDVREIGGGTYKGRVPAEHDFTEIVEGLERQAGKVLGLANEQSREIEFSPLSAHVYRSLDELLSTAANQIRVPERFTLLDIGYTGPTDKAPDLVLRYFEAVQLWSSLIKLADHVVLTPPVLHFLEGPQRKLEIIPGFTARQLAELSGVPEFNRDFVKGEHHLEQKKAIVRITLVDIFDTRSRVSVGDLIERFDQFKAEIGLAYAVFSADFSYKKIRDEIDRQNLDDTLRLNKTLSDIQNQLLALPAALILAAAGLEAGRGVKNIAIVFGVSIFAVLMVRLVRNQKSSVESIAKEVKARISLVKAQPLELSTKFEDSFSLINARVTEQLSTLDIVLWVVFAVWLCVTGLAIYQW